MRVSVCLASYNGEKFIGAQLKSILYQLEGQDELIVSDDGSTDRTVEIINSFNDPRIRIIRGEKKNLIKNFENALLAAKGDYIFLSDQDDEWVDGKIEKMLKVLQSGSDLAISDCRIVDSFGNTLVASYFAHRGSGPGFIKNLWINTFIGCCMAFNRKIKEMAVPFPNNIPMHDAWIGLVSSVFGKVEFINDQLLIYRRHESANSTTGFKNNSSFLMKLKWRLFLLIAFLRNFMRIFFVYLHFRKDLRADKR